MNYLTAMLLGTVQLPPPAPKRPYTPRTWNTGEANKARHEQAVARYKAVMGSEWVKTSTIEARRGIHRTACTDALKHYLELELIERRPVGGTYVRTKGYEWRWK